MSYLQDEKVSVLALPDDSPLLTLDYGLLTVIGETVKELRRDNSEYRRNHLIKGTRTPILRAWLFKLDRLGEIYPDLAVFNLPSSDAYENLNKDKMSDLIVDQDIPLASLEHAYTLSQKENYIACSSLGRDLRNLLRKDYTSKVYRVEGLRVSHRFRRFGT